MSSEAIFTLRSLQSTVLRLTDENAKLGAALATAISEQIRLSLEVLTLTNERDEARALGRLA